MTPEQLAIRQAMLPLCEHCGERYPFERSSSYGPTGQKVHFLRDVDGRELGRCPAQQAFFTAKRAEFLAETRAQLAKPDPERVAQIRASGGLPKRTRPGLETLQENGENHAALAAVRRYFDGWASGQHPESGRGLYLFSERAGTGKTAAVLALAFDLLRYGGEHSHPGWLAGPILREFRRPTVQFWTLFDLFEAQKMSFRGETEFDPEEIKTCDLLILDEMGKLPPTSWNLPALFSWLNIRDSEMRPTLFTSNYSLNELTSNYITALGGECARDVKALRDRIAGNCEQVEFSGPSWRAG